MRNGKHQTGIEGNIRGNGFASFGGIQSDFNQVRLDHQPPSERIELLATGHSGHISRKVRNQLQKNAQTLPPEAVANAYVNQNIRLDEAQKIFEDCLASNPENFQARWGMGLLLCRLGDFSAAFDCFSKALSNVKIKRRINQYDLWTETAFRIGRTPEQIYDAFEEWLRVEPDNQHILTIASKLQVKFPKFTRLCLPDILQRIRPLNKEAGVGVTEWPRQETRKR